MGPVSREFPEFLDSEHSSIFSETLSISKLLKHESFELNEIKLVKLNYIQSTVSIFILVTYVYNAIIHYAVTLKREQLLVSADY